jgi:hypothetical protein
MKKMIFLMLTLLILSSASMNAQVNIGSINDPHKGAVLDLSQGGELGLLLPHVSITNVRSFQLPTGDNSTITNAVGMTVYNTNPALGEGLFTWNGSEWKPVSSSSAGSCSPVTATSSSSKTGVNTELKVTVTAGTPTFTYTWYKNGVAGSIRTVSNVTTANDTYTTAAAGTYTCQVVNSCTTAPVSFTFIIGTDGSSENYVDNGNGTYTDDTGNLVVIGEGGEKEVYEPVESDIPGIYKDENDEIVYTGADGIPGTADDDVFVQPNYPIPTQETLFSVKYPVITHQDEEYQIQLDFADGPDSYTGRIKYLSTNPDVISVSDGGILTVRGAVGAPATIVIVLEDGSVSSYTTLVRSSTVANANKLAGVRDNSIILAKETIRKISTGLIDNTGFVNSWNVKSITYEIDSDGGTGSTVTPGGWFHAGTSGDVTVTVTATDDDDNPFTGTITVTILGDLPPEEQPYEITSTNWTDLEPALAYAGGDGTISNPYLISSVRQFKKLSVDITLLGSADATYQKYFELTTDLDFSDDETVTSTLIEAFNGNLDGKGHVIKNLNIDATGKSSVSLFNRVAYGEIKNLGREGGSTIGANANSVSGLVLTLGHEGKLSNCYNSSSINILNGAGGLVYNTFNDTGVSAVIENCYNTGNMTSTGGISGGLVAVCLTGGATLTITNSYNTGNVNGTSVAGGLIGNINGNIGDKRTLNMTNCFNFGNVVITSNNERVGAILGGISNSSELVKMNAINVYSRPDVASANNGIVLKSNHPIGWSNSTDKTFAEAVLDANPTLGENPKYTLEYSKSSTFATELGSAFKFANGRTPKLAWEE